MKRFLFLFFILCLVPLGFPLLADTNGSPSTLSANELTTTGGIFGAVGGLFFYVRKWFVRIETLVQASEQLYKEGKSDIQEVKGMIEELRKK